MLRNQVLSSAREISDNNSHADLKYSSQKAYSRAVLHFEFSMVEEWRKMRIRPLLFRFQNFSVSWSDDKQWFSFYLLPCPALCVEKCGC